MPSPEPVVVDEVLIEDGPIPCQASRPSTHQAIRVDCGCANSWCTDSGSTPV
jgi:hypothetical protein